MELDQKLAILADAAKYDASCASSGTVKRNSRGGNGLGSTTSSGICHSWHCVVQRYFRAVSIGLNEASYFVCPVSACAVFIGFCRCAAGIDCDWMISCGSKSRLRGCCFLSSSSIIGYVTSNRTPTHCRNVSIRPIHSSSCLRRIVRSSTESFETDCLRAIICDLAARGENRVGCEYSARSVNLAGDFCPSARFRLFRERHSCWSDTEHPAIVCRKASSSWRNAQLATPMKSVGRFSIVSFGGPHTVSRI